MKNKKLIKQIGILSLIILGFAVFNYSFYSLFTKNYINNCVNSYLQTGSIWLSLE